MICLRSLMTKCVAAATCKCRRRPLAPGGKGQQPAYSYDEGFAKGLILNLFYYLCNKFAPAGSAGTSLKKHAPESTVYVNVQPDSFVPALGLKMPSTVREAPAPVIRSSTVVPLATEVSVTEVFRTPASMYTEAFRRRIVPVHPTVLG